MSKRDFSTEGIHARTISEVGEGVAVIVRDARGGMNERIASSGVVRGRDFMVVWVCRPEEWKAAQQEGREPDSVPWPAEDVWLPGDAP